MRWSHGGSAGDVLRCFLSLSVSITQVIDLLEGLRCLPSLSLLCERIVDVSIRDWLLAPAVHKDGRYCSRKLPLMAESQRENAADEGD